MIKFEVVLCLAMLFVMVILNRVASVINDYMQAEGYWLSESSWYLIIAVPIVLLIMFRMIGWKEEEE